MTLARKLRKLLRDPLLPVDRGCRAYQQWRRRRALAGSAAADLRGGQLSTLELLTLLRPHPPRVIYDVGAMTGTWTRLSKAIFPSAVVHAFEPLSVHQTAFTANLERQPGVTLHPVALAGAAGEPVMEVASLTAGSSLLPLTSLTEERFGIRTVRHEQVTAVRLDEYAATHRLPPPDLIKLDVQGYELEVLLGAERAVAASTALLVELSFVEIYRGQPLFDEVERYCVDRGFRLHAFGSDTCLGRELLQADALFIRP